MDANGKACTVFYDRKENVHMRRIAQATAVTASMVAVAVSAAGPVAGAPAGPRSQTGNSAAVVTVRADQPIAALRPNAIGVNTPIWNPNLVHPAVSGLIRQAGLRRLVFNGGPVSDLYHWADGSVSPDPDPADHPFDYSTLRPQFDFDQFAAVARSAQADMLVHVNYGTGTPAEAAGWVRYANLVKRYGVRDWEIGEEVYLNGHFPDLNFEPDAHADKSPQTYAANVTAYARAMKAIDPSIRIGVGLFVAGPGPSVYRDWNETVLRIAGRAIDFVDLHWYPSSFAGGGQADLIASADATAVILPDIRATVDRFAGPRVAIVIGETNSAVAAGPDQVAPFNALFLAVHSLALLQNGAESVDVWALHNWSNGAGDLGLLASGGCSATGCAPPDDTPYPSYFGVQLATQIAGDPGVLLRTASADGSVRAYASRRPDGNLAVLLANTDPANPHRVRLEVSGRWTGHRISIRSFQPGDNAIRIQSGNGQIDGLRTLPPYSLTVLTTATGW